MKFPSPITVQWIADFIGATIQGNENSIAIGINELHKVENGDIVFVDHPKYYKTCIDSAATVIIIDQLTSFPEKKTLLIVENPFEAYLKIVNHFRPFEKATKNISDSASIGSQTYIAPNAFIGNHVTIGNNCIIQPNVSIMDHSNIGNNVVIQSGTVIGSDAFYYNTKKNRENWYKRMDSCGAVVIEDDVEIGANCTIDRGVTHNTFIGKGTKIDNLVQLGHDVVIGKNCLIASQVGIAGATTLEDGVILWGQVGVNKTIRIGKGAIVMGQSGVFNNLEGGKVYMGFPAEEAGKKRRELIWIRRIPEIWEKLSGKKQ
jgi:UDP-3-O-[3-hydroxymyristoyl] glucosamine N-acyltransferase